jgi:Acetyltransferases
MIRCAELNDKDAWFALDEDIPEEIFDEKVRNRQGYVCIEDGKVVGLLRYGLFWDLVPFCNLLLIDSRYRGKGFGRQLMEHWENEMKSAGFDMVMVSTQVDEDAQHFYRKLGYRDAGGFVVDIPGHEQPMEMIMIKGL